MGKVHKIETFKSELDEFSNFLFKMAANMHLMDYHIKQGESEMIFKCFDHAIDKLCSIKERLEESLKYQETCSIIEFSKGSNKAKTVSSPDQG